MAKVGRPGKYETHVLPHLQVILAWRRKGCTELEIAKRLGVGASTFAEYKKEFPELLDSLKGGLEDALSEVENSHFRSACGFEYEEKRIIYATDEDGKPVRVIRIEVTKKFNPPNVTAQIHFLKNRDPKFWHDRRGLEITGADDKEIVIRVTHMKDDDEE